MHQGLVIAMQLVDLHHVVCLPLHKPRFVLPVLLLQKSIKCYSYLEGVELEAAGGAVLEVYRKPVDAKRKARPTLLTSKPMYLHITRRLVQH